MTQLLAEHDLHARSVPVDGLLLSIVVPCFNEEDVLPLFLPAVSEALDEVHGLAFEIVFVNDGSSDRTLDLLVSFAAADSRVRVLDFSRNFGKEAALSAGLREARGDLVVPFDADLQDPPDVIARLVDKWREGYDVVIARRADRSSDSVLKRRTAHAFYWLHNKVADIDLPENAGDFRLMTRGVVDALNAMPERCRFMKGLFAWAGFRTAVVEYARAPRAAGTSKFSGWRLWNFALEGITGFSTLPLRVWTYLGLAIALLSIGYAAVIVMKTLLFGVDLPGYASLMTIMLFLGGMQMVGMGVIGEYIGRIYFETKNRPLYLVRARYGGPADLPR